MVIGIDVADDFGKLLIVAPIFQLLREGGWNGSDLKYAIPRVVAVCCHGGVACGDGARVPQCPDLRALELSHQSPVATLDLCRCLLLCHGDKACPVEPFQCELGWFRGDFASELDGQRILEVDRS